MALSTRPQEETSSVSILVVEDERIIARDICASLENLGYRVPAIASTGEEAIRKAEEFRPHLILMDIRLKSEIDGIQAAEQIWKQFQIPFIYATGYSDRNTLERAKATSPFGYILKPIEERELYVAVETALQRFRLSMELQKREQWLTTILKGIGDGVIVVDAEARIKFLNLSAETVLQCSQIDVQDRPITDVFQVIDERTLAPIQNPVLLALERGEIALLPDQTLLVIRGGTAIPIADSAAPLRNENGVITGAVLVFRDVTEKRLAEERNIAFIRNQQLQAQMTELQRINQLKDDFLSTISHELRTPLANIKMAIRMLEITLNHRAPFPAEVQKNPQILQYLEILRDQCDRELNLVNDLLDFQRLSADAYTLDLTTVHLSDWMAQITEGFQARLQDRQIRVQSHFAKDLPAIVSDAESLHRIFTELLGNACKYSPPGEQILITIELLNAEQIQIKVCNTGVEIAADEIERIFEPFYRIPQSDRWRQGGTGLGLSLVKKLAAVLGGTIWAESGSGQTCFILQLPITLASLDRP